MLNAKEYYFYGPKEFCRSGGNNRMEPSKKKKMNHKDNRENQSYANDVKS